jgi:predicted DNA-binding protein
MTDREKLSDTFRVRIPPSTKRRVARLCRVTGASESDVVRYPLEAYWPETEQHFLAQAGRFAAVPARLVRRIAEAQRMGIDVDALLTTALAEQAPAEVTPFPPAA